MPIDESSSAGKKGLLFYEYYPFFLSGIDRKKRLLPAASSCPEQLSAKTGLRRSAKGLPRRSFSKVGSAAECYRIGE
jgi:hypothetical protein